MKLKGIIPSNIESTIPTRKSNEYEYEYGLFLYNATVILDNPSNFVLDKGTSQMFVWLKIK